MFMPSFSVYETSTTQHHCLHLLLPHLAQLILQVHHPLSLIQRELLVSSNCCSLLEKIFSSEVSILYTKILPLYNKWMFFIFQNVILLFMLIFSFTQPSAYLFIFHYNNIYI